MLRRDERRMPSAVAVALLVEGKSPTLRIAVSAFTSWRSGKCCVLSRFSLIGLFATPWTGARQAPLPMGIL